MAFLTSRTLASGVTGEDLIHIVITGDTSQGNSAGSSYKAKINQLPGNSTGSCFTNFYVDNLYGCPSAITFHDSYQSVSSTSNGIESRSFGISNTANGDYSHSEGYKTESAGDYSHSEGSETITISEYSHSEGINSISGFKGFSNISASTIVNGVIILTGGTDYTSEFTGNLILITDSDGEVNFIKPYVLTNYTGSEFEIFLFDTNFNIVCEAIVDIDNLNSPLADTIYGRYSHSEGINNKSLGKGSHSEGGTIKAGGNVSIGEGSHSEGISNYSIGESSHVEGASNYTFGGYSHSEGVQNITYGEGSHSEGNETSSYGDFSHSEGKETKSGWVGFSINNVNLGVIQLENKYGDVSSEFVAPGSVYLDGGVYTFNNVIFSTPYTEIYLDDTSIMFGNIVADTTNLYSSFADFYSGDYSHSEGFKTKSIGRFSHSEGGGEKGTLAYGDYSHTEGGSTEAYGDYSHAEGYGTVCYGYASHTEGLGTVSYGDYQLVIGQYNKTGNTTYGAFIIGNGDDDLNRDDLLIAANTAVTINGVVGVGTTSVNDSAILQLDSIKKGFLPPRMDASDAETITAVEGLMVYVTGGTGTYITSTGWWGYTGNTSADWAKIGP